MLATHSDINFYCSKPRRISEIWNLNRNTKEVVALGGEGLLRFNPMGSEIWLKLDGQNTIESIIEAIAESFPDRNRKAIDEDVTSFIDYLVNHKLILLEWVPM